MRDSSIRMRREAGEDATRPVHGARSAPRVPGGHAVPWSHGTRRRWNDRERVAARARRSRIVRANGVHPLMCLRGSFVHRESGVGEKCHSVVSCRIESHERKAGVEGISHCAGVDESVPVQSIDTGWNPEMRHRDAMPHRKKIVIWPRTGTRWQSLPDAPWIRRPGAHGVVDLLALLIHLPLDRELQPRKRVGSDQHEQRASKAPAVERMPHRRRPGWKVSHVPFWHPGRPS